MFSALNLEKEIDLHIGAKLTELVEIVTKADIDEVFLNHLGTEKQQEEIDRSIGIKLRKIKLVTEELLMILGEDEETQELLKHLNKNEADVPQEFRGLLSLSDMVLKARERMLGSKVVKLNNLKWGNPDEIYADRLKVQEEIMAIRKIIAKRAK